MKKLALVALAAALSIAPAFAMAATNTDNGPPTTGGRVGAGGPPGQNLYLHTHSIVSATITPACTRVSANDAPFGNVQPSNVKAQTTLAVSWDCGAGIRPVVSFESFTSHPCAMNDGGTNNIPYKIYANGFSGDNLCNADNSHPPTDFYKTTAGEAGNSFHVFNVETGNLINGNGVSLYPTGNYSDQVEVYLEF